MKQQEFGWTVNDDSNPPESVPLITVERSDNHINAVMLFQPEAPLDQRRWRIIPEQDGSLTLQLWNDAEVVCEILQVRRVGVKPVLFT